jgi:hypothetical protein
MNRLLAVLVPAVLPALTRGLFRQPMLAAASDGPERGRTRGAPRIIAHRPARGLLLLLVIVIVLVAGRRPALAAGPVTVSVSPATAAAMVGADFTLDIDAANVSPPGLGGYVIVVQWNPAILTLRSLSDSGWVTSGQVFVLCTTPTINNTAGYAELDCTPIFGFGSGVTTSAPHALAYAVFHANAPGTTAIDLTGSELLDPVSATIPVSTFTNGSATVFVPGSVGGIAGAPDIAALPPQMAGAGAGRHRSNRAAVAIVVAGGVAAAGAVGYKMRAWRR